MQGTGAKVYVDEFNFHSDFYSAWKKLFDNFLEAITKEIIVANLENMV